MIKQAVKSQPPTQNWKLPNRCNNNNFLNNFNQFNIFRALISPILRSTRLCLNLVAKSTDDAACWWPIPHHPCHQQAASSVLYTTSRKHSLMLLRMGEIIVRNMLSWLKLLIKLVFVASSGLFILLCQWCTVTQTSELKMVSNNH